MGSLPRPQEEVTISMTRAFDSLEESLAAPPPDRKYERRCQPRPAKKPARAKGKMAVGSTPNIPKSPAKLLISTSSPRIRGPKVALQISFGYSAIVAHRDTSVSVFPVAGAKMLMLMELVTLLVAKKVVYNRLSSRTDFLAGPGRNGAEMPFSSVNTRVVTRNGPL